MTGERVSVMKKIISWAKLTNKDFFSNNCSMHAAGLTYFSMLALVPILCVLLVAAKTFGVDNYAEKQINLHIDAMIVNIEKGQDDELAKLTTKDEKELEARRIAAMEFARQAREISNALFDRIDKFDISTLGWIGFGFLLWTVVSSISMVEVSFNQIFRATKSRAIWLRILLYLTIAVILPIFAALVFSLPILNIVKNIIVATMGATWLTKWVSDGIIWFLDSWVFRFAFVLAVTSIALAFNYWLLPNRRVRWRNALFGGMVTSVLFGGWMKACAIAQVGISKSSALYGSFAFLPIILAWFYMSWQIILLGACMTHAFEGENKEEGFKS